MKTVLISINKPHTDNIFSGDKGVEWRKKPLPEGPYYVYETKNKGGCGMVIGEMRIVGSKAVDTSKDLLVCLVNAGRVHPAALKKYANNGTVYANFIKDAKRYDVPKQLSEFVSDKALCYSDWLFGVYSGGRGSRGNYDSYLNVFRLKRPPQSWCYVKEVL